MLDFETAAVTDSISAQLSGELGGNRQLILIPLNHRSHWSLLVYCRPTRMFHHYNSINRHNRSFAECAAERLLRLVDDVYRKLIRYFAPGDAHQTTCSLFATVSSPGHVLPSDKPTLRDGGNREGVSDQGTGCSRKDRLKMESEIMERAGLLRDLWLMTVEDIEYPHCMRRIRALVLELQRQYKCPANTR
ncbi:hypothetical protein H4S07_000800 [Coemansia furcata]|uniref:Uncharacterized protein n=1 Tax=Coemansia furcata TaxID=417177 RepID=A0ACC1LPP5_9FUNG|nr:hypothetical protein H4S07_000800 [Coemansia furcata]